MIDIYTIFDKSRNAQPVFNFNSFIMQIFHIYVPISAGSRGLIRMVITIIQQSEYVSFFGGIGKHLNRMHL